MNRNWGIKTLGTVPADLLATAQADLQNVSLKGKAFSAVPGEHWYVQSYVNAHNVAGNVHVAKPLASVQAIIDWFNVEHNPLKWPMPDVKLIEIKDRVRIHLDQRLWHRLSNRYIIDLLNVGDDIRYFMYGQERIEAKSYDGHVFQFNNDLPHYTDASTNLRYSIIIDLVEPRLFNKFPMGPSEILADADAYCRQLFPELWHG